MEASCAIIESLTDSEDELASFASEPVDIDELITGLKTAELQVMERRWKCDLCFESYGCTERSWELADLQASAQAKDICNHQFCRHCIVGCIQWGCRCPYDNVPFPQIVICGAMGTADYLFHEKSAEARRIGGIMCANADCPGVTPISEGPSPQPVQCVQCGAQQCGRRICGVPWTENHRCWDIVADERRRAELAEGACFRRRSSSIASTKKRLAAAPRIRPCPTCGVMVEHIGGCNMIFHDSCNTSWCFVCRRIGTCSDFNCRYLPEGVNDDARARIDTDTSFSAGSRTSSFDGN